MHDDDVDDYMMVSKPDPLAAARADLRRAGIRFEERPRLRRPDLWKFHIARSCPCVRCRLLTNTSLTVPATESQPPSAR
jgi:hypothetical protein